MDYKAFYMLLWIFHHYTFGHTPLSHNNDASYAMIHSSTGHWMSPEMLHKIHRDLSEISIVSSWALTVVFHCEYQPQCWWISLFSANYVTNSHRPLWCQSKSGSFRHHLNMSAVVGLKGSLEIFDEWIVIEIIHLFSFI